MSTVLFILALVTIISSIVFFFVFNFKKRKALSAALCILGVILLVVAQSFTIVPTGYTGVRTTFGQIDKNVVQAGINFKIPFVQSIDLVNNKQQDIDFNEEDIGKIGAESSERTSLYMENIVVTYSISSEKSAWIYANVSNYEDNLVSPRLVASALKSASKQLNSTDVTNRAILEPLAEKTVQESLDEKYGSNVVTINKIVINNIVFDEDYDKAIAEKQNAQLAYEKQQIANKQAVEKAQADAEVKKKEAEAEAEAVLIKAEAEAKANKKINDSLSDKVIEYNKVDKWNGELPYVSGSSTPVISLPSDSEKD